MNIEQLEETIGELTDGFDAEDFICDLLLAYELPKASVTRLRKGTSNLGKGDCDLLWKNRVCYTQHDSRILWGEGDAVHRFWQASGLIVMILGALWAAGIIWTR